MSDADARKRAFRRSVRRQFKEIDEELRGRHKKHLDALLRISGEEIDAITPNTTDMDTYSKLIVVVSEATRKNVAIADLRQTIRDMGTVAMEIARKVPGLMS